MSSEKNTTYVSKQETIEMLEELIGKSIELAGRLEKVAFALQVRLATLAKEMA